MRQEKSECSYILAKLLHDLQDWDAALAAAQALYLMWVQMDVMVSAAVYSTVTVARRIWGRLNPQFCFDLSMICHKCLLLSPHIWREIYVNGIDGMPNRMESCPQETLAQVP